MIQSTMDLFIAPKVPKTPKSPHVTKSEGFSKFFEDMAGSDKVAVIPVEGNTNDGELVIGTILEMIGTGEEENKEQEPADENGNMLSLLAFLNIAQIQPSDETLVEEQPPVDEVVSDVQQPASQNITKPTETILKFNDPAEVIIEETQEETEEAVTESVEGTEQDEPIGTHKSSNIAQSQTAGTAGQLNKNVEDVKQVKDAEKTSTAVNKLIHEVVDGEVADVLDQIAPEVKSKLVTAEEAKSVKTDKFDKPEVENKEEKQSAFSKIEILSNESDLNDRNDSNFSKFGRKESDVSEKIVKKENIEQPETRPSFSEFLNGVSEQRVAKAEGRPSVPLQYNLLNTGRTAFTEGMENVVRFAKSEGVDRATLIIDPPALGRVTIEIASTANGIETALKVNNEQVRALVQDQIVQLKHSLQQIGVQVTEFSVDIHQQDKGHGQFAEQKQKNRAHGSDKEDDMQNEEEVFRVDLRKGILHWIA